MNTRGTEIQFNLLHKLLVDTYIQRVSDEDCSAADLNGARQLLKDNDVVLIVQSDSNVDTLNDVLKQKREKRKLKIVGDE